MGLNSQTFWSSDVITKKNSLWLTGLASAALLSGCASVSGTPVGTAYVVDSSNEYVRDAAGDCVRTGYWSRDRANEVCDPDLFATAPAQPASEASMMYEVQRGDSLWNISAKSSVYGNPYHWPLIYRANADQIRDADLIYPGQRLRIELRPSAADVDAAVRHARTRGAWSLGPVEATDLEYLRQYNLTPKR